MACGMLISLKYAQRHTFRTRWGINIDNVDLPGISQIETLLQTRNFCKDVDSPTILHFVRPVITLHI